MSHKGSHLYNASANLGAVSRGDLTSQPFVSVMHACQTKAMGNFETATETRCNFLGQCTDHSRVCLLCYANDIASSVGSASISA